MVRRYGFTLLGLMFVLSGFMMFAFPPVSAAEPDPALLGYWPLKEDTKDYSGKGRDAVAHKVQFSERRAGEQHAATFNGVDSWLEVPAAKELNLGRGEFTFSLWASIPKESADNPGDLLGSYDPARHRGFHLALKNNPVTFSQANQRELQFAIDDNQSAPEWVDCGRPGNALIAFALAVHDGQLYAGTCEPGKTESGRVYRYDGPGKWIDCGAPDQSNAVTVLTVFNGQLYAGTGKYRVAGSALPESENTTLGGRVFRYEGEQKWADCGRIGESETVGGLVVFKGKLYGSSLYKPPVFARYDGGTTWTDCGVLEEKRVEAMAIHDGYLYGSCYDGGRVVRYDGEKWTNCGVLGENTQTYSFAIRQGRMYVGTWPSGKVYRFEDIDKWTDVGRLGEELEVMGMLNHNGRLIAGTLPLAEVYEYTGETEWTRLTRLDFTDVKFRRAWTMAEHQGQVFCSTLPSGKIFSWSAGRVAMAGREMPSGWQHIAAVKGPDRLRIYLNGKQVAESAEFDPEKFDLSTDLPIHLGRGPNDFFQGQMAEVKLFSRALSAEEVGKLAKKD